MVYNVKLQTDFTTLEDVNTFTENTESVLLDVANEVQERNKDTVLRVMSEYPQSLAKHPFEFATAKSRRYYFWMISQGMVNTDGTRYIRTNKLAKSWKFEVITNKRGVGFIVKTNAKMARYVGGTMAISKPSLAQQSQVAGHRRTGWQTWVSRLNPLLDSVQGDFETLWRERVREVGTPAFRRRGYSTPRKNIT